MIYFLASVHSCDDFVHLSSFVHCGCNDLFLYPNFDSKIFRNFELLVFIDFYFLFFAFGFASYQFLCVCFNVNSVQVNYRPISSKMFWANNVIIVLQNLCTGAVYIASYCRITPRTKRGVDYF